jgi:hypothetical protein
LPIDIEVVNKFTSPVKMSPDGKVELSYGSLSPNKTGYLLVDPNKGKLYEHPSTLFAELPNFSSTKLDLDHSGKAFASFSSKGHKALEFHNAEME